jgi:glycerol uptake facilitator-like aquaporin
MSNSLTPKLVAQFIGTFALVFIGAGAASIVGAAGFDGLSAVAFAHGLTLMIFICAYGSISGGHMNSAVTVGVLAVGAITAAEVIRSDSAISQCSSVRSQRSIASSIAASPSTISPARPKASAS